MKGKRKWKEVKQTYINGFLFSVKRFSYVKENEENEGLDVLFFTPNELMKEKKAKVKGSETNVYK